MGQAGYVRLGSLGVLAAALSILSPCPVEAAPAKARAAFATMAGMGATPILKGGGVWRAALKTLPSMQRGKPVGWKAEGSRRGKFHGGWGLGVMRGGGSVIDQRHCTLLHRPEPPLKATRGLRCSSSSGPGEPVNHEDALDGGNGQRGGDETEGGAGGAGGEADLPVCLVRVAEDEPHMTISLDVAGRVKSMSRVQEEEASSSMLRLARVWGDGHGVNMGGGKGGGRARRPKKVKGKGKRRQAEAAAAAAEGGGEGKQEAVVKIEVDVYDEGGALVDREAENREAWRDGGMVVITMGEAVSKYRIQRNMPEVTFLTVDTPPIIGYTLHPRVSYEFATPGLSVWRWLRRPEASGFGKLELVQEGSDPCYTPRREDLGSALVVECTPVRAREGGEGAGVRGGGETWELSAPVGEGPDLSVHEERFEHARATSGAGRERLLRVVSYNILADNYASTRFAREELYGYCPEECLALPYRKQLAAHEVLRLEGDVLCLQEVTRDLFDTFLVPVLGKGGYDGAYTNKLGMSAIGCATFWRRSAWESKGVHMIDLANGWQEERDFARLCSGSEQVVVDMSMALLKSTTVAQAVMLEQQGQGGGRRVCVVNTHLFGHPDATHVRLIQTGVMGRRVDGLLQGREVWSDAGVVVCGDMNSLPEEGVSELLGGEGIGREHQDWWRGLEYKHIASREEREAQWFDGKERTMEEGKWTMDDLDGRPCLEIESPLALKRACEDVPATICLVTAGPQVVDHIFYSPSCLSEATKPFPFFTKDALTQDTGLPSARFASDHVALVADLEWLDE